jgi:ankyrin repeat protein
MCVCVCGELFSSRLIHVIYFLFLLLKLVDSIKEMDPRLAEAALNGNTIELQKLLQEDSLLLVRDSLAVYPETALHIATMGGQTDFVRELLKLKPDFATRLNKDGFSAIHKASANGFAETMRELLKFSRELVCNDLRKSASHIWAITPKGLVNLKLS